MQLSLPLFTKDVTLINSNVGVFSKGSIVYYLLNGLPIYSHSENDRQAFRFFTSNLIHQSLCKKVDIQRAFNITIDQVNRSCRIYEKEGEEGFFKPSNRYGRNYKLIGENLELAQKLLDEGNNNCDTARQCNVGESAIRSAIKRGLLKKNFSSKNSKC